MHAAQERRPGEGLAGAGAALPGAPAMTMATAAARAGAAGEAAAASVPATSPRAITRAEAASPAAAARGESPSLLLSLTIGARVSYGANAVPCHA